MKPAFVEHDWLLLDPWISGYGPAPFEDALLISAGEERRALQPFAVARETTTRAHVYPAWVWALYDALAPIAPEKAILEGVAWALTMETPRSYAQALATVYHTRWAARDAEGLASNAIDHVRLLRVAMQDLGDAAPPRSHEDPDR